MDRRPDTIVAQATPSGRGGVSIIRVSGPQVKEIAQALLGQLPFPRKACFSSFLDEQGRTLDQGIALFFPGPQSFTSEDVLELQGHGSPVLMNLLIQRISSLGARLARPGEFSERAFLNGKLDLAQAESIADLIQASTEEAARSALRSLQGEFSRKIQTLLEHLTRLRIHIEAAIDFAEEELDLLSDSSIKNIFEQLLQEIAYLQKAARQGSLLREGLSVVIAGKPNVGKSTLLNVLCGKEAAIVTDIPGTTRDTLKEEIQIDGLPLHLVDTAGLRETQDPIEQEGIRRTQQEIRQADLLLYLVDANEPLFQQHKFNLPTLLFPLLKQDEKNALDTLPAVIIRNKIDLSGELASSREEDGLKIVSLSAKKEQGLNFLKEAIKEKVGFSTVQEGVFSARQRHLEALEKTKSALNAAFDQLQTKPALELVAEELRHAQNSLGEITGKFTTEDLLGQIFSSFCIGK